MVMSSYDYEKQKGFYSPPALIYLRLYMKGKKAVVIGEAINALIVFFATMYILMSVFGATLSQAFTYSLILGVGVGIISSKYLPWNHL